MLVGICRLWRFWMDGWMVAMLCGSSSSYRSWPLNVLLKWWFSWCLVVRFLLFFRVALDWHFFLDAFPSLSLISTTVLIMVLILLGSGCACDYELLSVTCCVCLCMFAVYMEATGQWPCYHSVPCLLCYFHAWHAHFDSHFWWNMVVCVCSTRCLFEVSNQHGQQTLD
jgi:hypothetical protein